MPTPPQPPRLQPPKKGMNNFVYVIVLFALLALSWFAFNPNELGGQADNEISITQMVQSYHAEDYEKIEIKNSKLTAFTAEGEEFLAYRDMADGVSDLGFIDAENPTEINVISTEQTAFWVSIVSSWLPVIFIIGLIVFMGKQLGKGASNAFSFGKSQARTYSKDNKKKTTFADVAGMDEAKEELVEIVDFLKHPKKYTKMGAKIPRGVVLVGNPGTGKTLLARAVAGEADVPFFSISGSEFVEMFVGVGASRVRDLFQKAKNNAPCIIFIDEIDAVGRQRGFGMGGGHDEREQTLNQILTEMDGFENETNVIVIAATNRPDVLDAALMRPGRFDRRVIIDMPNLKERREILKVHVRNKNLSKSIDLERIARKTPGFSGADLENLLNESAILATKNGRKEILNEDLDNAIEKVGLGPEKKSRRLSDEEKKITAYHEVGHALVGKLLPGCDPVEKVSIIPRGMALGVTWFLPEEDQHLTSISKFKDRMCSLIGGHAAEQMIFGEVTTGASSDLKRATDIARSMVKDYGMSALGPVIFGEQSGSSFMGAEIGSKANYSQKVAYQIDEEISRIMHMAQERTMDILKKNKTLLDKIAQELLKKEELSKEEFDAFFESNPKKKVASKK